MKFTFEICMGTLICALSSELSVINYILIDHVLLTDLVNDRGGCRYSFV